MSINLTEAKVALAHEWQIIDVRVPLDYYNRGLIPFEAARDWIVGLLYINPLTTAAMRPVIAELADTIRPNDFRAAGNRLGDVAWQDGVAIQVLDAGRDGVLNGPEPLPPAVKPPPIFPGPARRSDQNAAPRQVEISDDF